MPDIDIGSYWIRSLWFWKLVSRYLSIIVRINHSSNHLTWVPTSMILLLFRVHWLKTRYFYRIFSTKRNISRWEIVMLRYYKSILMIRKSIPLNRIFSSSMKKELKKNWTAKNSGDSLAFLSPERYLFVRIIMAYWWGYSNITLPIRMYKSPSPRAHNKSDYSW